MIITVRHQFSLSLSRFHILSLSPYIHHSPSVFSILSSLNRIPPHHTIECQCWPCSKHTHTHLFTQLPLQRCEPTPLKQLGWAPSNNQPASALGAGKKHFQHKVLIANGIPAILSNFCKVKSFSPDNPTNHDGANSAKKAIPEISKKKKKKRTTMDPATVTHNSLAHAQWSPSCE